MHTTHPVFCTATDASRCFIFYEQNGSACNAFYSRSPIHGDSLNNHETKIIHSGHSSLTLVTYPLERCIRHYLALPICFSAQYKERIALSRKASKACRAHPLSYKMPVLAWESGHCARPLVVAYLLETAEINHRSLSLTFPSY